MSELNVTPIYTGVIALIMVALSVRTGIMRGQLGIALGDGANSDMILAMRRFGNLSEYAAMALLILLVMELQGISAIWLHAYGAALVAFRLLHPITLFDRMDAPSWKKAGRFIAAAGTATLIGSGALAILFA